MRAPVPGHANHQSIAPIADVDQTRVETGHQGPHRVLYLLHIQPQQRHVVSPRMDGDHGETFHRFRARIPAPGYRREDLRGALAQIGQHIQIVTVDAHGKVRSNSADQLVESHLDRLGQLVLITGNGFHQGAQFIDKARFAFARVRPGVARF